MAHDTTGCASRSKPLSRAPGDDLPGHHGQQRERQRSTHLRLAAQPDTRATFGAGSRVFTTTCAAARPSGQLHRCAVARPVPATARTVLRGGWTASDRRRLRILLFGAQRRTRLAERWPLGWKSRGLRQPNLNRDRVRGCDLERAADYEVTTLCHAQIEQNTSSKVAFGAGAGNLPSRTVRAMPT